MKFFVQAVSVAAPGLNGWEQARGVLSGKDKWQESPLEKYRPQSLPPNEQRRATELVRTAFRVAEEIKASGLPLHEYASVFASSGGDYSIIHQICQTLVSSERMISPTQFHNSVHNSAAGYWSIATGGTACSLSISAFDHTFTAGLLEAMALCHSDQCPVLLVTYDIVPPKPLNSARAISMPFASAIALTAQPRPNAIAELDLALFHTSDGKITPSTWLPHMVTANPAARCLPLLEAMLKQASSEVWMETANGGRLHIGVTPC